MCDSINKLRNCSKIVERQEAIHARERVGEAEELQGVMLCKTKRQKQKYRLDCGSLAHPGNSDTRQRRSMCTHPLVLSTSHTVFGCEMALLDAHVSGYNKYVFQINHP